MLLLGKGKNREESRKVNRRAFIGLVGAGAVQFGVESLGRAQAARGALAPAPPSEVRLAGMSLPELRQWFYNQLFQVLCLPPFGISTD